MYTEDDEYEDEDEVSLKRSVTIRSVFSFWNMVDSSIDIIEGPYHVEASEKIVTTANTKIYFLITEHGNLWDR